MWSADSLPSRVSSTGMGRAEAGTRLRRHRHFILTATAVAAGLLLAGCGIGDRIEEAQEQLEEAAEAAEAAEESGDDGPGEEGGDLSNDIALGWRLSGPTGSLVEVDDALVTPGADDRLEQSFSFELDEAEPREFLYTAWVSDADVTVTVTEGGPVQVELMRGYQTSPSEPGVFPEIVYTETLEMVMVAAGETTTVSGVRVGS